MTRRLRPGPVAAVAIGAAALVGMGPLLLRTPDVVSRVSVVNRSVYDVHVEVTGEERDGWVSVTTAQKGSTTVAGDVVDHGDVWIFRFQAQGREGGELRVARTNLQRSGWSFEVPESVTEQLRRLGTPPTP